MNFKTMVGTGDKIMGMVLPAALIGIVLNILYPDFFQIGGFFSLLWWLGIPSLILGLVGWIWSVYLIATIIPQGRLITTGPFRIALHPLYMSIGLFVVPGLALLLNSWVGLPVGAVLVIGVRIFATSEERALEEQFGEEFRQYRAKVLLRI